MQIKNYKTFDFQNINETFWNVLVVIFLWIRLIKSNILLTWNCSACLNIVICPQYCERALPFELSDVLNIEYTQRNAFAKLGGSKFWHITNIGASRDDQNGRCMKIVLASTKYSTCLKLESDIFSLSHLLSWLSHFLHSQSREPALASKIW